MNQSRKSSAKQPVKRPDASGKAPQPAGLSSSLNKSATQSKKALLATSPHDQTSSPLSKTVGSSVSTAKSLNDYEPLFENRPRPKEVVSARPSTKNVEPKVAKPRKSEGYPTSRRRNTNPGSKVSKTKLHLAMMNKNKIMTTLDIRVGDELEYGDKFRDLEIDPKEESSILGKKSKSVSHLDSTVKTSMDSPYHSKKTFTTLAQMRKNQRGSSFGRQSTLRKKSSRGAGQPTGVKNISEMIRQAKDEEFVSPAISPKLREHMVFRVADRLDEMEKLDPINAFSLEGGNNFDQSNDIFDLDSVNYSMVKEDIRQEQALANKRGVKRGSSGKFQLLPGESSKKLTAKLSKTNVDRDADIKSPENYSEVVVHKAPKNHNEKTSVAREGRNGEEMPNQGEVVDYEEEFKEDGAHEKQEDSHSLSFALQNESMREQNERKRRLSALKMEIDSKIIQIAALIEEEKYEEASELIKKTLQELPNNDRENLIKLLYLESVSLRGQDKLEDAIIMANKALAIRDDANTCRKELLELQRDLKNKQDLNKTNPFADFKLDDESIKKYIANNKNIQDLKNKAGNLSARLLTKAKSHMYLSTALFICAGLLGYKILKR